MCSENGGVEVIKTKKRTQKMAIPAAIIGVLVVTTIGLGIGWLSASSSSEASSLRQKIAGLQENYNNLAQNYAELEENSRPSFSSGTTYNQVIAWDYTRISLTDADTKFANNYWADNLNLLQYKIADEYIRGCMLNLINDIEAIRNNASSDWNASIDKFIEAAEWDIRGFDNYAMYAETQLESYWNFYLTCYSNASSAQDSAWKLMPI